MVLAKWLRSLRYGNEFFKLWNANDYIEEVDGKEILHPGYFSRYEEYILNLLVRPRSIVRMAVLTDDRDVVLGWSLVEGQTLHYVHVQHDYRNQGIGRSIVPSNIETFSHITKAGMSIWASKGKHAKFDPGA